MHIKCIVGDFETWTHVRGTILPNSRRRSMVRVEGYRLNPFLEENVSVWDLLTQYVDDACKRAGTQTGKLEKVLVYVTEYDEQNYGKAFDMVFVQEKRGFLTYVIPQPYSFRETEHMITKWDKFLEMTPDYLRRVVPRVFKYIQKQRASAQRV